jgi:hypothetical protein
MDRQRLIAAAVTVILALAGIMLIAYGWPQRHIYYQTYRFDTGQAHTLRRYPPAMRAYGEEAWDRMATARAAGYFHRAAAVDTLDMDAWLGLAYVTAARGDLDRARRILAYVADLSGHTSRWQRTTALLAHELDMEGIFRRSVNFMLRRGLKRTDTLNLVDVHYGDTARSLDALDTDNHPAYLAWLLPWDRAADARRVWARMAAAGPPDEEITLKYLHYLISKKDIQRAQAIWQTASGITGMTNGGFEQPLSGRAFDWRAGRSREGYWQVRRVPGEGRDRSAALKVSFHGRANVNFHHLYQIVPVTPETPHRLHFWWRAERLTTDQGPFVEVVAYDGPRFHQPGSMLTGFSDWQAAQIAFTPPPGCTAVTVRLRRRTSNSFDNKIQGRLWLDDFHMEELPAGAAAPASAGNG